MGLEAATKALLDAGESHRQILHIEESCVHNNTPQE